VKTWIFGVIFAVSACGAGAGAGVRVGYVVTAKDDTPAGRTALGAALGAGDDVVGDGFVVRLDDAGRARVAAMPAVAAIAPLAVRDKVGALPAGVVRAHIDLYDDATAAEADAVAAWVTAHGGAIGARGATWIEAKVAAEVATAAAALAAVRWVEAR
jgi:hypothetical protein